MVVVLCVAWAEPEAIVLYGLSSVATDTRQPDTHHAYNAILIYSNME